MAVALNTIAPVKTGAICGTYRRGERGIRTPVTLRVNRISSAAHSARLCHLSNGNLQVFMETIKPPILLILP